MGIYNGDIGIIQRIDLVGGTMEIDFDGRRCEYTLEMAPELDLAYAVTVHKSLGSEYSAVVLRFSAATTNSTSATSSIPLSPAPGSF